MEDSGSLVHYRGFRRVVILIAFSNPIVFKRRYKGNALHMDIVGSSLISLQYIKFNIIAVQRPHPSLAAPPKSPPHRPPDPKDTSLRVSSVGACDGAHEPATAISVQRN